MQLKHDSRDISFKEPFGAVKAGETVSFSLEVTGAVQQVALRLWDGYEQVIKMQCQDTDGDKAVYSAKACMPSSPCLIWYYFIVDTAKGHVYYGNNEKQLGGIGKMYGSPPPSYQITVYNAVNIPSWLEGGMIYQIFPDRFYNPYDKPLALKPDSILHDSWYRAPLYARDKTTDEILSYDFFGGNLDGITAKLDYLEDFGVKLIYLNPIFLSVSNHRFDTADYEQIDPVLGDEAAFMRLCREAKKRGMYIIIDGVFSHTGSDSRYFNKEGTFGEGGAYQSPQSPYYSWYRFKNYPHDYESWWGIGNLPNVDELNKSYLDYIVESENSIVRRWIRAGAKGWRLDVADELPEEFIRKLRSAIKEEDKESFLLGEVWEDASHKTAYGFLRCYFLGDQLDSVMNYPFRENVLGFLSGQKESGDALTELYSLYENYPQENFNLLMNLLGTHDTPRLLTTLAGAAGNNLTDAQKRKYTLDPSSITEARKKLWLALVWQMTFAGLPSVYYADEAGAQGFADPFNRGTYPWGKEDVDVYRYYWRLSRLRQRYNVFQKGGWEPLVSPPDVLSFRRLTEKESAVIVINRKDTADEICLESEKELADILNGEVFYPENGRLVVPVKEKCARILQNKVIYPDRLRKAGILLHPSSLPSEFGIGDIGPESYRFIELLAETGHGLWQMLPIGPVDEFGSPYAGDSAFAGNVLLISPELMAQEGYLTAKDLLSAKQEPGEKEKVHFDKVRERKNQLFVKAYKKFTPNEDYKKFCVKNSFWLDDYALYRSIKEHFSGKSWQQWPKELAERQREAVNIWQENLSGEISFHKFLQYEFWRQWHKLRAKANEKGIAIIGDIPIYLAADSVDVWMHSELFDLLPDGSPAAVAGVPPDYFSATGQLWGNPLYKWDECRKDGYLWWKKRLEHMLAAVNIVRLDHFCGFEAYWRIPAGEKTAENGRWEKGPGEDFLLSLRNHFGALPFIAEDLGVITEDVGKLRDRFDLPGMDVLQFGLFGDNTKLLYTGTHDNDTLIGWLSTLKEKGETSFITEMAGISEKMTVKEAAEAVLRFVYKSGYTWIMLPMQDVLALPASARMNTPSSVESNWRWRVLPELMDSGLRVKLQTLINLRQRKNAQNIDEIIPGMW